MLTPQDLSLLDTASQLPPIPTTQWAAHVGTRHGNDTLYWQQVNALINTREALEYAPTTVAWLRRIREHRSLGRGRRTRLAA